MKNPYAQQEQTFLSTLKRGTVSIYDLVMQAAAIWNDSEFHNWRKLETTGDVESYLSDHLSRVLHNVTVSEVLALAAMFPDRKQWGTSSLVEMIEQATAKAKSDRQTSVASRTRVTRKEFETAQKEAQFFKAQSERNAKDLQDTLSELQELKSENLKMKGRIEELERIVSRDLIAA